MFSTFRFLISKGLRKFLNPPAIKNCSLDSTVRVWDHSTINNSLIGKYSYVSDHTLISNCEIGSYCSISSFCQIGGASHPMNYVSSSPIFLEGHNPWDKHLASIQYKPFKKTKIGNDVWIGTHVLISGGISIGDGAVIGMGSVVTHDIEPYSVVGGIPAQTIKKRFDDSTIEWLESIQWWNWQEEKIKKYSKYFNSPELLKQEMENNSGEI